jgi:hypothetical protein
MAIDHGAQPSIAKGHSVMPNIGRGTVAKMEWMLHVSHAPVQYFDFTGKTEQLNTA